MKTNPKPLLLAFLCGFSIMVVELTATRLMAPTLGNSIFTWTSVIGVILLASAIGGKLGGTLIDAYDSQLLIAATLFLAGLFILFLPQLSSLLDPLSQINASFPMIVLISSFTLFFLPAFFLGATYPMLFKRHVLESSRIGSSAGSVSASWSLGSILGTFMTGFYFIGFIGSARTLLSVSTIIFLCGIYVLTRQTHRLIFISACGLLFGIHHFTAGFHPGSQKSGIIYHDESDYYDIRVADFNTLFYGKNRILLLDADTHSIENLSGIPLDMYTAIYPAFSVFNDQIKKIAVIGAGSFSLSSNFADYYPGSSVTTIEIDPKVVETSKKYFAASDNVVRNSIISDGRVFLSQTKQRYDVIFCDAYNSYISIPWHMSTSEFFELAKSHLSPDGAFAINFISANDGGHDEFFDDMLATFTASFPNYYVFSFGNDANNARNHVFIGLSSQQRLPIEDVARRLAKLPQGNSLSSHLRVDNPSASSASVVLTDDFAPVDRFMIPTMTKYFLSSSQTMRSIGRQ